MRSVLSENASSQRVGSVCEASRYPRSESDYFRSRYGSDNLHQHTDKRQQRAIMRYARPEFKREVLKTLRINANLECEDSQEITHPGRSAVSLQLLRANLAEYKRTQARSLRWNEHYQAALASVAKDVIHLLHGYKLQPMSIKEVAASESVIHNFDKNAGYIGFQTNQRSKGENIDLAVEWCEQNLQEIMSRGYYGIPYVIAHRSSNSKPSDDRYWKWRCRIILMQDLRALLYDGHFAIPFKKLFENISWGEGGMHPDQVSAWVMLRRREYPYFYSSDYSRFDVSQPVWLLEDMFNYVVRPCFGELSSLDELWFNTMRDSYIHKEIHGFDGPIFVHGCQVSGALTTYCYNTIINEIIDRTALLMQGCNLNDFVSLKCGDDNLTYHRSNRWSKEQHCKLIHKYFGIKTTIGEDDYGTSTKDPSFLSRKWTFDGRERPLQEVLFNLVYPERYRNYDPNITHVTEERAIALVIACACVEQDKTMRHYFKTDEIFKTAGVSPYSNLKPLYQAVATLGTGFRSDKVNYQLEKLVA